MEYNAIRYNSRIRLDNLDDFRTTQEYIDNRKLWEEMVFFGGQGYLPNEPLITFGDVAVLLKENGVDFDLIDHLAINYYYNEADTVYDNSINARWPHSRVSLSQGQYPPHINLSETQADAVEAVLFDMVDWSGKVPFAYKGANALLATSVWSMGVTMTMLGWGKEFLQNSWDVIKRL